MAEPNLNAWYTATNPHALLDIVYPPAVWPHTPRPPSRATLRRVNLFGCACARSVWNMLPTDARNAVAVRERYTDGRATEADLRAVGFQQPRHPIVAHQHALSAAARAVGVLNGDRQPVSSPDEAARAAAKAFAARAAGPAPPGGNPVSAEWQHVWNTAFAEARAHQCELIRDIFPPPGYAPALRPDWRTSTVVALARQMDDTGDFSAVPILADALQDAGCDNDVMLARCRAESGVHCRGNWVVDLVLGRE